MLHCLRLHGVSPAMVVSNCCMNVVNRLMLILLALCKGETCIEQRFVGSLATVRLTVDFDLPVPAMPCNRNMHFLPLVLPTVGFAEEAQLSSLEGIANAGFHRSQAQRP